MKMNFDEIVITPDNEQAANALFSLAKKKSGCTRLYISGPENSGKSVLLNACDNEGDLLRTRKALCCHPAEILTTLRIDNDAAFDFLSKVGGIDLLLIDDVDAFLNEGSAGAEALYLLLKSRFEQGLDTVVASRVSLSDIENARMKQALAKFEEHTVKPLQDQDLASLAKSYALHFTRNAKNAKEFSEDAFDFIGTEFANNMLGIEKAIEYLATVADYPEGTIIDAEIARKELCI